MSLAPHTPHPAAVSAFDPITSLRAIIFVAGLLLAWITLSPFPDLSSSDMLELAGGREGLTYGAFGLLAIGGIALVAAGNLRALWLIATPGALALIGWILITIVISQDMGTSIRRFVLFAMVASIAASLFFLPTGRRNLAMLLAAACGILLGLSYLGVALMPSLAVHQATDILEAQLAGDWRGVFGHKNTAGAVLALCFFMGIYIARSGLKAAGIAIAIGAGFFLLMSGAKSSTMLLVLTLAISGFVTLVRSPSLRFLAIVTPLITLFALGPGTLLDANLAAFVRALPVDVTFTGRTDVWELAFDKIAERPWQGYGFGAFWSLESTRFGSEDNEAWAGAAAHAHNGYIDAALNMGLIGLGLTLLVVIWQPFRDWSTARMKGADAALSTMLLQIWIFGILLSVMESFLFVRSDPVWLTFLFAIFGLRYLANFPAVRE